MSIEIERKFLLINDDWRAQADSGVVMRQGYLSSVSSNAEQKSSVRVRIAGEQASLNIKGATLSITRQEYEYPIPLCDAHELLDSLADGPLIEKKRYHVQHDAHMWEIDVFEGDNQGLVVAEIELASEDEIFARPAWLGEEVSADARYYNVCLVRHPYKNW
ncbi:MAG: CYTH domain-containing protein [Gammaproteobacteria bacterium]|nr:CYTH domain-containing protein [Gammaproteobacteria bacterium]